MIMMIATRVLTPYKEMLTIMMIPGIRSALVPREVDEGKLSKQRLSSLVLSQDDLQDWGGFEVHLIQGQKKGDEGGFVCMICSLRL